MTCSSKTAKGTICKLRAVSDGKCHVHLRTECTICYEERRLFKTNVCPHRFCRACLDRIYICALCRTSIRPEPEVEPDSDSEPVFVVLFIGGEFVVAIA